MPSPTVRHCWFVLAAAFLGSPLYADDADIAKQAEAVLKANCYRCHGQNGAVEGGMNFVLDRDKLVGSKKIIPGNAELSPLFKRVSKGKMPPEGEQPRPSETDIALLKQWIDKGAASAHPIEKRTFIAESDVHNYLLSDLEKMDKRQRRFVRYFTLSHLYNAGLSEDELQTYRNALSKLVNSLSWHPKISVPVAIDPAKTVLRIDLRDFQWDATIWNRVLAEYPHGVIYDTATAKACYVATGTRMPYVRADWFVATASRPPLYHDLLQLPTNDRELETLFRIDVAINVQQEKVVRAGFNSSGVSKNSRMIERHDSVHGAYWKSYDFADNIGRHNLFAVPLGPGILENTFEHAGGEVIFNLPNGLQAYLLVNANGRRVNKAPPEIVSDPKRPDRAVENGLSCINCHAQGMIFKADQIRDHVEKNANAFSKADAEAIKALYVPEAKFKALLEEDSERFKKAVEKTGSKAGITEPIMTVALRYEAELDLAGTAAELGFQPEDFLRRLSRSPVLARSFGSLKVPGGTVQRQVFLESLPDTVKELRLGTLFQPLLDGLPLPDNAGQVDPFEGQTTVTNAVAFSADGKLALLGSADKTIRVWDVENGKELRRFIGHTASVWSVAFSPDGKRALSGSADKTLRLWDVETGQELRAFEGHSALVTSVAFSRDGKRALSGAYDRTVILWDLEKGEELRTFKGPTTFINSVAFSPDGKRALISGEKTIFLWDLEKGQEINRFDGHANSVIAAVFSPDGRFILSASDDRTARLWEVQTGKLVRTLEGHTSYVKCVAFSADGRFALTGAADNTARVWEVQTGKQITQADDYREAIVGVAISADSRLLLAASRDATVRAWSLTSPITDSNPADPNVEGPPDQLRPASVIPVGQAVGKLMLSPNRKWLYYVTGDKLERVNTATLKRDRELSLLPDTEAACLSPDGKTFYAVAARKGHGPINPGGTTSREAFIQVIDPLGMQVLKTFSIQADPFDIQATTGGLLFLGGAAGSVTVVDVQREAVVAQWGDVGSRSFLRLNPEGDRLYYSGLSGTGVFLLTQGPPAVSSFPNREKPYRSGEFLVAPDGKFLLLRTGSILTATDLQVAATIDPFLSAAVDPDLQVVLTVTRDGSLKHYSYPDFKLQGSYRLDGVPYQIAVDGPQARLYAAVLDPEALSARPRAQGLGDLHIYDLKPLLQKKGEQASKANP